MAINTKLNHLHSFHKCQTHEYQELGKRNILSCLKRLYHSQLNFVPNRKVRLPKICYFPFYWNHSSAKLPKTKPKQNFTLSGTLSCIFFRSKYTYTKTVGRDDLKGLRTRWFCDSVKLHKLISQSGSHVFHSYKLLSRTSHQTEFMGPELCKGHLQSLMPLWWIWWICPHLEGCLPCLGRLFMSSRVHNKKTPWISQKMCGKKTVPWNLTLVVHQYLSKENTLQHNFVESLWYYFNMVVEAYCLVTVLFAKMYTPYITKSLVHF